MVAAWIKALTGVGPSIASGSQTCSGNCADLPTAPQNTSTVAAVEDASGEGPLDTASVTPSRGEGVGLPVDDQNADQQPEVAEAGGDEGFLRRRGRASGLRNQKPMSRYEQRPTSSQNIYSCRKFGAEISAPASRREEGDESEVTRVAVSPCI